jgi:molybdenum cofactor cytidylyltransferase
VIPGIILAAGRSTRMGEPKALLPITPGGPTFVRQIATVLLQGGLSEAIVVGRADDIALKREVEAIDLRVRFVANDHADRGQLSSLVAGLNAADRPGVPAVLVTLVDVPSIRTKTIEGLVDAYSKGDHAIVRAVHGAHHGHPVIFSRAVFDALRHADPSLGAKPVMRAYAHEILDVEVDDPGVLLDVDRPEDYANLMGRRDDTV